MHIHIRVGLQLKDVSPNCVQNVVDKIGNIIEMLEKLIKL